MTTIKDIWAVMKSMYPHAFKEYGPVGGPVFRYWEADLDGADLNAAFVALRTRASEFPPSLPEFKAMCGLLLAIPQSNEAMREFAIANGFGDAYDSETWKQYRSRIDHAVEQHNLLNERKSLPRLT
jgi:hypothetical protein